MSATRSTLGLASGVSTLVLALAATACAPSGSEGGDGGAVATTAADDAGAQAMVDHLLVQLATARSKIEGLADAMPESTYDWRPGEGVRSVGEVFQHVAADNYLLPAILGVEAPDATGITTDYATVQAYEARSATRDEIMAELRASFDHLEAGIEATRGDLDRTATAFGTEFTAGGLWTMAITHLHEHLGQGIAYARGNGVVPPWSR
ncbi:MAG: DinB family protein [Longimicrobiales bacterium]